MLRTPVAHRVPLAVRCDFRISNCLYEDSHLARRYCLSPSGFRASHRSSAHLALRRHPASAQCPMWPIILATHSPHAAIALRILLRASSGVAILATHSPHAASPWRGVPAAPYEFPATASSSSLEATPLFTAGPPTRILRVFLAGFTENRLQAASC